MEDKKISVVIPCYNLEKYIGRTIESVLHQTYDNVEIILIDDGSKDGSLKVMQSYRDSNPDKIKLISQKNQGVSAARNNGLKECQGEYVCLLDGDDMLEKTCFEKVMARFNATPEADICFYGYKSIDEEGNVLDVYEDAKVFPNEPVKGVDFFFEKAMRRMWISTGSAVYKRSLIEDHGIRYMEGYKYGEDVGFINECISRAELIECVPEDLFLCLERSGSATRSGINEGYIDASHVNRILNKKIKERNDIDAEEKKKLLMACDIDYIHVTTAAAKNVVYNVGKFSSSEAGRLYRKFGIDAEDIDMDRIKECVPKAKRLEWNLFCNHKFLFFYSVKLYKTIK